MSLGMAFPFFYAIALFAITIQYIVERYTLAVFYRLPQKFSVDITVKNNSILAFGPLFGFALGFWMLGNRQMFTDKDVSPLSKINGTLKSDHTIGSALTDTFTLQLGLSEALMFIAFCCVIAYFLVLSLWSGASSLRDTISGRMNLNYQESQAPEYFSSLREQDLEELVDEELIFIQEFGVQNMNENNIQMASQTLIDLQKGGRRGPQRRKTLISGEPYYQIYKNFDYWLRFNN